jgi:hypothetical protein
MAIHIGRREFLVTLGGAIAWPLTVRAQRRTGCGGSARDKMALTKSETEARP